MPARLAGALSLLLWAGVIACGRLGYEERSGNGGRRCEQRLPPRDELAQPVLLASVRGCTFLPLIGRMAYWTKVQYLFPCNSPKFHIMSSGLSAPR